MTQEGDGRKSPDVAGLAAYDPDDDVTTVLHRYRARVARGDLQADHAQEEVAAELDRLAGALAAVDPKPSGWTRLFGARSEESPRGLYIVGDVGRGKTMLMDLFYEGAAVPLKRRVHFHAFMVDVHARIHAWREARKRGEIKGDDPIAPAALAAEARLLCFDEFTVTDIADAMILGRLFTALFADGVTVVATSNVAPEDLYSGGLNRTLFLPFIALLGQRMETVRLDAARDFRYSRLTEAATWFAPVDDAAGAALDRIFRQLTGCERGEPARLPLLGREILVPEAVGDVARFPFAALCEAPMGSVDFLAIARHYGTVLVDGIRVMRPGERDVAKRFINLVDTLYDERVKLIASAACEPDGLYNGDDGREIFEFRRTVSRLVEMRSEQYLALPHGHGRPSADTGGIVET